MLGANVETAKRLAIILSAAFMLLFMISVGYKIQQTSSARRAYEACNSLSLPLKLDDFTKRFGPAVGIHADQKATTHEFEPSIEYSDFTSGSISVTTPNGSTNVTEFYCGS